MCHCGTLVALQLGVRTLFLAWVALALLLLGLGRLTHAAAGIETAGFLTATEQDAQDGYFAVGPDAVVVVKQGSGLQRWLRTHTGQQIRLALTPLADSR
jgi:hypothetical protein